jgi:hypothetical protein
MRNIFCTAEEWAAQLDLDCGFHRALRGYLRQRSPIEDQLDGLHVDGFEHIVPRRTYSLETLHRLAEPRFKLAHYYAYAIPNRRSLALAPAIGLG